ncbi:hypothetical protein PR202_gb26266 [Eleusine coracana subsp. coracana]|uniref:Glutaredoxin domain-containing protein n=1 Tax=Eleusine coracana subsp. coracana TaxID=191504 RepID=A0AAV5FRF0_ELECO|nr:hypothetical protein PR202_gb26266 [Eleusine coracana subsp. coracana]
MKRPPPAAAAGNHRRDLAAARPLRNLVVGPGMDSNWASVRGLHRPTRKDEKFHLGWKPQRLQEGAMARLVSTALVKGLVRSYRPSTTAEQAASQPAIQQFMNYSSGLGGAPDAFGDSTTSRVAADPDTHQDFQPTSKSSGASLHDIVAQDIKENPVIIYMKGHPDAPRCGFSALAVKVLQQYGVRITSRDILTDLKLKDSVKAHT